MAAWEDSMRRNLGWLAALSFVLVSGGCAASPGVRYVYQDGDFGVVGMPENSDAWPTHYRQRAEKLMEAHFPEGHEIVRAEEVVEGERTLTLEDSRSAELLPQLPAPLGNIGKVGRSESVTRADTVKIKECRIVYRRVGDPDKTKGYASAAGMNPPRYLDPNEVERRKAGKAPAPDRGAERDDTL
jgi:hypothetical protein